MSYTIRTSSGELYHHGTKNMHWYQRRYQNEDGTWTEEGKKLRAIREGYGEGSMHKMEKRGIKTDNKLHRMEAKKQRKQNRMDKATQRKVNQIKAKRAKAEYDAKKAEDDRQKKIKTGDIKTIMDMQKKGQLSNQELQSAIDRLKKENELAKLAPQKKNVFDKLESAGQKIQKVANFVNAGKNAINAVHDIKKILSGDNKKESKLDGLKKKGSKLMANDILDMVGDLSTNELQEANKRLTAINFLKDKAYSTEIKSS